MAWNPFRRAAQGPAASGTYLGLRDHWLSGAILQQVGLPPARRGAVAAAAIEFGRGGGAVTLVAAEDGTASMYTSSGGGTIGMGFQVATAAAAMAFVGTARSFAWVVPKATGPAPPPRAGAIGFHLLTLGGRHSVEVMDEALSQQRRPFTFLLDAAGMLHSAGQDLVTAVRLLDERRAGGSRPDPPQQAQVHLFADGGICLLPGGGPPTFLTAGQLARILEIARSRGDRVAVSQEPGVGPSHGGDAAIAASGTAVPPAAPPAGLRLKDGATTLHYAVAMARQDLVEDLLARRAAVDKPDAQGCTPLMEAARSCRPQALEALLAAGADLRARDRLGNSVLMFAAQSGEPGLVRRLLQAGADASVRGQDGFTALSLARQWPGNPAIPVLEREGAR